MLGHRKSSKIKICCNLFANLVFSITIILLNKWIYSHKILPNIALSMSQFIITFLGLCVCEQLNFFNVKSVHLNHLMLLTLCFCGFVVLTNLSLEYNSIGTFQVAKMLTTPGVVVIQILFYKKNFSLVVQLTLLPIIVGVILYFYYDIQFNVYGTIFAMLGVAITSLYQVLVNLKQSELQLDPMQLLYYQAPLSAVLLCCCIPVFESSILTVPTYWSITGILIVFASGMAALFVNLTTYWIISNTSSLTYNMLGHSKVVLVTFSGWYLFEETVSVNQWFGIGLTLTGIILYTHMKMQEKIQTTILIGKELGPK